MVHPRPTQPRELQRFSETDAPAIDERMAGTGHQQGRLAVDHITAQLRIRLALDQHADERVEFAAFQLRRHAVSGAAGHRDMDAGGFIEQALHRRGNQMTGRRRTRTDVQFSGCAAQQLAQVTLELPTLGIDDLRVASQQLTRGRRLERMPVAQEQLRTQLLLEATDALADSLLRQPVPCGCSGEAAFAEGRQEVTQLMQFHCVASNLQL